jgi:hypothetical protein
MMMTCPSLTSVDWTPERWNVRDRIPGDPTCATSEHPRVPSADVTDEQVACPYLGLPDDSRTRFAFATPAHRCYAKRRTASISLSHQGSYCLSTDFPTCERFPADAPVRSMVSSTQEAAGREAPAVPDVPPGQPPGDHVLRRTPVINVGPRAIPVPPTRAEVAAPPTTSRRRWVVALGVVLLMVLMAAIILVVAIGGLSGFGAASSSEDPVRVGTWVRSLTG